MSHRIPSSWRHVYFQTKVSVWHRLVHRARAQDIDLYSHRYAPVRLRQELLTPFPASTQTSRHGNQGVGFDIVERYHISTSHDGFARLLFIAHFIQRKRKATNFTCAHDRHGDRSCPRPSRGLKIAKIKTTSGVFYQLTRCDYL